MNLTKKSILLFLIHFLCAIAYSQVNYNARKKINSGESFTLRTAKVGPYEKLSDDFLIVKGRVPGNPELTFIFPDSQNKENMKYLIRIRTMRKKTIGKSSEYFYAMAAKIKPLSKYADPEYSQIKIMENENVFVLVRKFKRSYNISKKDSIETMQITYAIINEKYRNEIIFFDVTEIGDTINIERTMNYFGKFIREIKPVKPFYNKKWDISSFQNTGILYNPIRSGFGYKTVDRYGPHYDQQTVQIRFQGTGMSGGRHIYENFWVNARFITYFKETVTHNELYSSFDATTVFLYNSVFERSKINTFSLHLEKRMFINKRSSFDIDLGGLYGSKFDFKFTEQNSANGPTTEHRIYYKPSIGYEYGARYRYLFAKQTFGFFFGLRSSSLKYHYNKYTINGTEADLSKGKYFLPKINDLDFSSLHILLGVTYQFF